MPAPVAVCSTCEVRDKCREKGYLSQTPKAQDSQVLCIAQPNLFLDPLHRGFFRQLSKGQPSDRMCVIDEAKAHELFIECSLSKAVLKQWQSDWEGKSLSDFADKVIDLLEKKKGSPYPYAVAKLVNDYSDKELRVLSRQCSRYHVAYEKKDRGATDKETRKVLSNHSVQFDNGRFAYVAINSKTYDAYDILKSKGLPALPPKNIAEKGHLELTPSQAFALGIYEHTDIEDINALPRLWEQSNWTPFQQLKAFIARYQREADAPIWYHDGVLRWVIPPVVHSRVKHLVCMSATLQKEGFERAFDNVDTTFIETPPTQWIDGAEAYQVRTGAYPRASLLDYDTDWQPVRLSASGSRFLGLIEKEVESDQTVKHVLITFNAVIDFCGKDLREKHDNLSVLSFHKMEGLDFTKSGIVFWVLGCPDVSSAVIEQRARVLFGNDSEALNYEYIKGKGYTDRRLQSCWESEVAARLQQAVGRARLNRLANTVVVFSNVLIPDFTRRTVGFVPEDLEVAEGLANLTEIATQRMTAEQESPKEHKQTRKELAAERENARRTKAEQKQTALSLYGSGVPIDEIEKRIGQNKSTVFRWIQKVNI